MREGRERSSFRRRFGLNARSTNFSFFFLSFFFFSSLILLFIYEGTKVWFTRYLAQIKRNFLPAWALSCDTPPQQDDEMFFPPVFFFFFFSFLNLVHRKRSLYGSFAQVHLNVCQILSMRRVRVYIYTYIHTQTRVVHYALQCVWIDSIIVEFVTLTTS